MVGLVPPLCVFLCSRSADSLLCIYEMQIRTNPKVEVRVGKRTRLEGSQKMN